MLGCSTSAAPGSGQSARLTFARTSAMACLTQLSSLPNSPDVLAMSYITVTRKRLSCIHILCAGDKETYRGALIQLKVTSKQQSFCIVHYGRRLCV